MKSSNTSKHAFIGIDTGGTFTDFVAVTPAGILRTTKILSTPDDPSQAIIQGLKQLGLDEVSSDIVHGTTVGTNAVLEGKVDPVVFVTNQGFADILTLGRQNRNRTYSLSPEPQTAAVTTDQIVEVPVRMNHEGLPINDFTADTLADCITTIKNRAQQHNAAIAVCLLFAWRDPAHEQQIRNALGPDGGDFISLSSDILPQIGEYERAVATWLNAAIGPKLARYFKRLRQQLRQARIAIMQSAGQTVAIEQAAAQSVRLLLSGPAGGLAAITALGRLTGKNQLLSFDMGGTSTDVAMLNNELTLTSNGRMGRWPLAVPMVDMHTIGAGGGSIAWLDQGGVLQVGPESAGASPGPACYGNGGTLATVTDANVVLGRIPSNARLGGAMNLNIDAARQAVLALAEPLGQSIEQLATGIINIANEHMARALRVMSAERGHDNTSLTLTSFGGAGGLHVCALAEQMNIRQAMVPIHSGVLSALGMLLATPGRELTQSILQTTDALETSTIESGLKQLSDNAVQQLLAEGHAHEQISLNQQLDCRYQGQSAWFSLPWPAIGTDNPLSAITDAFVLRHQQTNGYQLQQAVEIVNLRVTVKAQPLVTQLPARQAPDSVQVLTRQNVVGINTDVDVVERASISEQPIEGPLIIQEALATLWLAPGWSVQADSYGNLLLSRL